MSIPASYLTNTANVSAILDVLRSENTSVFNLEYLKRVEEKYGINIDKGYITMFGVLGIIRPNKTTGEVYQKFIGENGKAVLERLIKKTYRDIFCEDPNYVNLSMEEKEEVLRKVSPGRTDRAISQTRKTIDRFLEYVGLDSFEGYDPKTEVDDVREVAGESHINTHANTDKAVMKAVNIFRGIKKYLKEKPDIADIRGVMLCALKEFCSSVKACEETDPAIPQPDFVLSESSCMKIIQLKEDADISELPFKIGGYLFTLSAYKNVYICIHSDKNMADRLNEVVKQYEAMSDRIHIMIL